MNTSAPRLTLDEFLRKHGCDYAQGYHIGKPVRAEAFGVLVASWSLSPSRT